MVCEGQADLLGRQLHPCGYIWASWIKDRGYPTEWKLPSLRKTQTALQTACKWRADRDMHATRSQPDAQAVFLTSDRKRNIWYWEENEPFQRCNSCHHICTWWLSHKVCKGSIVRNELEPWIKKMVCSMLYVQNGPTASRRQARKWKRSWTQYTC